MRLIVGYFIFIAVVIAGLAGIGAQADAEEGATDIEVEQAVTPAGSAPQGFELNSQAI